MHLLLGERCQAKSDRSLTKRAEDMRKKYKGAAKQKYKQTVFLFAEEKEVPQKSKDEEITELQTANLQLKEKKIKLQKNVTKNLNKMKTLGTSHADVQAKLRDKTKELVGIRQQIKKKKKADKKREVRLQKCAKNLTEQETEYKPYNVKRRLASRDESIKRLNTQINEQTEELNECHEKLKMQLNTQTETDERNEHLEKLNKQLDTQTKELSEQLQKLTEKSAKAEKKMKDTETTNQVLTHSLNSKKLLIKKKNRQLKALRSKVSIH